MAHVQRVLWNCADCLRHVSRGATALLQAEILLWQSFQGFSQAGGAWLRQRSLPCVALGSHVATATAELPGGEEADALVEVAYQSGLCVD